MIGRPCFVAVVSGPGRRAYLSRRARRDWWVPHRYDQRSGRWVATSQLAPPTLFDTVDAARAVTAALARTHTSAFARRLMVIDASTGEPIEMAAAR